MTIYEKICVDKVFAASMLSEALYGIDYEDDDFEPHVMDILNSQYEGGHELTNQEKIAWLRRY